MCRQFPSNTNYTFCLLQQRRQWFAPHWRLINAAETQGKWLFLRESAVHPLWLWKLLPLAHSARIPIYPAPAPQFYLPFIFQCRSITVHRCLAQDLNFQPGNIFPYLFWRKARSFCRPLVLRYPHIPACTTSAASLTIFSRETPPVRLGIDSLIWNLTAIPPTRRHLPLSRSTWPYAPLTLLHRRKSLHIAQLTYRCVRRTHLRRRITQDFHVVIGLAQQGYALGLYWHVDILFVAPRLVLFASTTLTWPAYLYQVLLSSNFVLCVHVSMLRMVSRGVWRCWVLAFQRAHWVWPGTALATYIAQRARSRDAILGLYVLLFLTLFLHGRPRATQSRLFSFFLT